MNKRRGRGGEGGNEQDKGDRRGMSKRRGRGGE